MSSISRTASVQQAIGPGGLSLGTHTADGAVWTIVFAGLNKGIALCSQVALAWFLLPHELGLFATAVSIASIASILSGANLKNIIIQQEQNDGRAVSEIFWLSLVLNLIGCFVVAAFA